MATLIIRKKGVKTWWHYPSDEKEYAVSKMYCKITEELFSVAEQGGRQRGKYNCSDITVYDDTQGGGAETFTSPQALMLRLEALEYIGFPLGSSSGGVGFQPDIVNPQNGQVITYDDGIWQNGYLDTNGDRFLSVGDILTDENEITLTVGFIGVINTVTSANNTDWVETINYTNTGYQRKDKIVFVSGGNFIRIQGEESLANPVEPITPINTLQVTVIDVFDDSIGTPTEPIDGSIYIKKPNDWVNISNAGNNSGLYDISEVLRAFNITSYYGSGKVTGFALGISGNNPFLVQTIRIKNSSEDEIPLEHNSGDLVIPFWFENEQDYILKPTEILTLVLKNGKFEIVSSSLGSSGTSIPEYHSPYTDILGQEYYYALVSEHDSGAYLITTIQGKKLDDGTITTKTIFTDTDTEESTYVESYQGDNYVHVSSDRPEFQGIRYGADYSSKYGQRSLIDLGFANNEYKKFKQRTGSVIAFDEWATYGTYASPVSGNLSYSLTNAIVGCVQVLYHEDTITPTFSQVGIDVDVDELDYQPNVVNEVIIYYRQPNKIKISITPM